MFNKWKGTLEASYIIVWAGGVVNGFQTLTDLKEFLQEIKQTENQIRRHKIFSIYNNVIEEITEA